MVDVRWGELGGFVLVLVGKKFRGNRESWRG